MYILRVNNTTGEIIELIFEDPGTSYEEGDNGDGTSTVIATSADVGNNSGQKFIERNYFKNENWTFRGDKPNNLAFWDTSNEVWDKNEIAMLAQIRDERNGKLFVTDWTMVSDSPLSAAQQLEVETYRTSLRDFPDSLDLTNISNPSEVVWPTPPSFL